MPSVLAIIVTFNPDVERLAAQITCLQAQGCDCLVVDNASRHGVKKSRLPSGVELRALAENQGLGLAQNIGIRHAMSHAYDYCLLMDQDSQPDDQMVRQLVAAHQQKSQHTRVAAVGPLYQHASGAESFFIRFGRIKFQRLCAQAQDREHCVECDFLISSGSLFATSVFSDVGLMDEDLFIDHVDTEWFLRAERSKLKTYGVCNAFMLHALGETTHRVHIGRRTRNVPQHKPFRYYYILRNSLLLYRRPVSRRWKLNDVQRLLQIVFMYAIWTPPRLANARMMALGVWHGVLGRSGPLNASRESHHD